jgi:hypothetical protein
MSSPVNLRKQYAPIGRHRGRHEHEQRLQVRDNSSGGPSIGGPTIIIATRGFFPGPVFPGPVFPGPVFPGPVFPGPGNDLVQPNGQYESVLDAAPSRHHAAGAL